MGQIDPSTGQPTTGYNFSTYHGAPLPPSLAGDQAKRAYQLAMAQLKTQRADTLDYYGYNSRGRIDPNNPYGAFQMQSREQGQQLQGLYNTQVGAGLGGSAVGGGKGLAQQQRNAALFSQGYEQANLLKEFQQRMDAIRAGRQEARWQRKNDTISGTLQSVLSAINAGQFTPAAPPQSYGGSSY